MHGTIISDWKIEDGNFKWNIKIPANTSAKVYIPAKNAEDVTEGGKSIAQTEGVKFMFMEGNTAVFNVESGSYNFVSKKF
jgi:alpha-L-rhamnosidase